MAAAKDAVGAYGERVAAMMLTQAGLEVLERNWRCPEGELDIVARDPAADEIVFVEVKTRSSARFGHPAEAVVGRKAARLRRLAAAWLAAHDEHAAGVRIDVVAVWPQPSGPARVEHLRAVV
ncbi:YraN family protein [Georgenia wangjunii]|uniref:YraN family protein n=1 Tax=Georgenia wangjunii TaxID=3117730 RepID=UPI002F26950A